MSYIKQVFDVYSIEQAKHVVLTSDPANPQKFQQETKFLVDVIEEHMSIDEQTKVLDFGCGMGRVSKELIDRFACKIFGLDISDTMLHFAKNYVDSNNFTPVKTYSNENSIDVALSVLALQHAEYPDIEIDNIISVLKPGGTFILLNENKRFVPSEVDSNNFIVWKDDKFDIFDYVGSRLSLVESVKYLYTDLSVLFYKK